MSKRTPPPGPNKFYIDSIEVRSSPGYGYRPTSIDVGPKIAISPILHTDKPKTYFVQALVVIALTGGFLYWAYSSIPNSNSDRPTSTQHASQLRVPKLISDVEATQFGLDLARDAVNILIKPKAAFTFPWQSITCNQINNSNWRMIGDLTALDESVSTARFPWEIDFEFYGQTQKWRVNSFSVSGTLMYRRSN